MNTGIEKRRHPRAQVWWPVILMSPHGSIMGTLRNISVSGALIFCERCPKFDIKRQRKSALKLPQLRSMKCLCISCGVTI